MSKQGARLAFIDALKAMTSQLIVLHHLALYGPLARAAREAAPALVDWLTQETRIVVQIFLVIGGFLAANSLAPDGALATPRPLRQLGRRYVKLAIPFVAALLISIACAAFARWAFAEWSAGLPVHPPADAFIPAAPTVAQFLAHVALLHGVLGFESLSAGVWYVAIDFQLFALLLALLWLARRGHASTVDRRVASILCVALTALTSLFYFNQFAVWDNWALYFFGAYSLGVLAFWISDRKYSRIWLPAIAVILVTVATALWIDYRARILVALMTALALTIACRYEFLETWPKSTTLAWLGKISYAVFLIHFPLLLVANAVFFRTAQTPAQGLLFMLTAWMSSIGAGAIFYRYVECGTSAWVQRLFARF